MTRSNEKNVTTKWNLFFFQCSTQTISFDGHRIAWKMESLRIVVFIFYNILFKWILLISANEWKKRKCNSRKYPRKWKHLQCNLRYLFDCCISSRQVAQQKKLKWKRFFSIVFFFMCSWKVLVLDEATIVKDIEIVSESVDDWLEGSSSHLVVVFFFDLNFRRMKCIIVVVVIQLLKIWRSCFPCFASSQHEPHRTCNVFNQNFFVQTFNYIL